MELKTLWLGLVLSLAAFAVKTGLGWAYLWRAGRPRSRLAAGFFIFGLYAALFAAAAFFVSQVNLLSHYETFAPLWRNGPVLHWLTALLLFVWGLALLRKHENQGAGRAWLALIIPCPVCMSVVLVSVAALNLYFPEQAFAATAGLFAAFLALAALGGSLMVLKTRGAPGAPEHFLGLAMLMTAVYFMLSALIAPQFSELGRVYRLSAQAAAGRGGELGPQALTLGGVLLLMAAGFFRAQKNIKNRAG